MRLLICGSRRLYVPGLVRALVRATHEKYGIDVIIEGSAQGIDLCGRCASLVVLCKPSLPFPANWSTEGYAAGPNRNRRMLREGKPTHGIAIACPDLASSHGTADMVNVLQEGKVPFKLFEGVGDELEGVAEEWIKNGCLFDSHVFEEVP